jgi:hypothetical protein
LTHRVTTDLRDQLWVELTGGMVVAKLRGAVSVALLEDCRQQVRELLGQSAAAVVLYDALELVGPLANACRPSSERLALSTCTQRAAIVLSEAGLRKALLLAFGGHRGECRIFSEDLSAAYAWLSAAVESQGTPSYLRAAPDLAE